MNYLYAAYGVTWAIHVFYLVTLVRRFRKLHQDVQELGRE